MGYFDTKMALKHFKTSTILPKFDAQWEITLFSFTELAFTTQMGKKLFHFNYVKCAMKMDSVLNK